MPELLFGFDTINLLKIRECIVATSNQYTKRKAYMKLGVNIDHIAVLREARKVADPDPLDALSICKVSGADQITIHLREDRRHMQDFDARNIIELSMLPVNLECSMSSDMIDIACKLRPFRVTLVPENREEITTEGGLSVTNNKQKLKNAIKKLQEREIEVSLFVDPDKESTATAKELGVEWIEFHTGKYANIYAMLHSNISNTPYKIPELDLPRNTLKIMLETEIENINTLSQKAQELGIKVAAGHGLNYQNVTNISSIDNIEELNIGQSIIARSIYTGLEMAVREMKKLIGN